MNLTPDVDAYPQGVSPFGALDLGGNVWQWTDGFQDEHTRAAILKGGSHYRPEKSGWYFPQVRQLNQHGNVLKLTVDHNKILHWWYSVGQGEFTAAGPFNDPWTPRQLEPSEKRLLAFRRQMADELAAKSQLSDATLLRLAGRHDEAELALRDLVAEHGLTGRAANLLALVCGEQGNTRDELHYAEKAASLNPENATIVGNYGCVLAETGKPDQAIPKMRLALQMDPELDYLYERLGDIYRAQDKEEEARREFMQAIRLLEKKTRVEQHPARRWNDLARLYQKTADYDSAAEAKSRSLDAHLNEVFEGDHRHRIAGPDSGF